MCLPVLIVIDLIIENVQLLTRYEVNDIDCILTLYRHKDYVTVTSLSECIPSLITSLPHFRCGQTEDQVKHGKCYPVVS